MNKYIEDILNENDLILRQRKMQKTINNLISSYSEFENNNEESKKVKNLENIQEIINFFKNNKINLRKDKDILLRVASLEGETRFIKWLLKEAICNSSPDVQIQLSTPLRFACLNGHDELVSFYLTDKDIKRSDINDVNGAALETVIYQKNMKMVKLFMIQPEIDIQIEHIRGIFKWSIQEQKEILDYILKNEVKEKFFKRVVQYRYEMEDKIKELIIDDKFILTKEIEETLKWNSNISNVINKKKFLNKLTKKLPIKGNSIKIKKI